MFEEDEGIDTYLEIRDGKIFGEFGNIVFPSKQKILRVENKDTVVSIFFEKRTIDKVIFVSNIPMNHINNFVFLFRFKGIDNTGGATVAQSYLDESRSKLFEDFDKASSSFNRFHHKLNALANHKLVYHGSRNEG